MSPSRRAIRAEEDRAGLFGGRNALAPASATRLATAAALALFAFAPAPASAAPRPRDGDSRALQEDAREKRIYVNRLEFKENVVYRDNYLFRVARIFPGGEFTFADIEAALGRLSALEGVTPVTWDDVELEFNKAGDSVDVKITVRDN